MCANVVIEDAAHIRNDDVTVDQRLVIVPCFGIGLRRLDPLQLLGVLKLLGDNITATRVGINYDPLSLVDRLKGRQHQYQELPHESCLATTLSPRCWCH